MAEKPKKQKTTSGSLIRFAGAAAAYILIYGLLFYGVVFLCQKGYQFCYEVFGPTAVQEAPGQKRIFQVNEEDTMRSVSRRLQREGLIVNQKSFYVRTELMCSAEQELRPGIYLLCTDMRYEEIINQLTTSEGVTP